MSIFNNVRSNNITIGQNTTVVGSATLPYTLTLPASAGSTNQYISNSNGVLEFKDHVASSKIATIKRTASEVTLNVVSTLTAQSVWGAAVWSPHLGIFLVLNDDDTDPYQLVISSDGINWKFYKSGVLDFPRGTLSWNTASKLFLVGVGTDIYSSADGIGWSIWNPVTGGAINLVRTVYSPELDITVAVGVSSNKLTTTYSTDGGITWPYPIINQGFTFVLVSNVIWASGLGVFVLHANNSISYSAWSDDGITWNENQLAPLMTSIEYSPTLNIIVGVNGNLLYVSVDGKNWTTVGLVSVTLGIITWVPDRNVFLSNNNAISYDGYNWTSITATGFGNPASFAWSSELQLLVIGAVGQINTGKFGTPWRAKSAPAATTNWTDITWSPALKLFAAVSSDGANRIMTSPTLDIWTTYDAGDSHAWATIIYAGGSVGQFIAVAEGSDPCCVANSIDGIEWVISVLPEANSIRALTYSPELDLVVMVASTGSNRVFTSPDGITWTKHLAAANSEWSSVTWSAYLGIFVAVSNGASDVSRVMTSDDGILWQTRSAAAANEWNSVVWSPELRIFVAVASTGDVTDKVMTSPDGVIWTLRSSVNKSWSSVIWINELKKFIAVDNTASTTARVMSSPDGTKWYSEESSANVAWNAITWAPELSRVAVVSVTDAIMVNSYSDESLYTVPTGTNGNLYTIGADANNFVISPSSGIIPILVSTDNIGTAWNPIRIPGATSLSTVAGIASNGAGAFMVVNGASIYYTDGANPWVRKEPPATNLQDIHWIFDGGGTYIACNTTTTYITTNIDNGWTTIAGVGGTGIASTTNNVVICSGSNIKWRDRTDDLTTGWSANVSTGASGNANSIASNNGSLLVVTYTNVVNVAYSSDEGLSWTVTSAAPLTAYNRKNNIRWSARNSVFMFPDTGTGSDNIVTSPTGAIWTEVNANTNALYDIAETSATAIAVGSSPSIMWSSTDAATWVNIAPAALADVTGVTSFAYSPTLHEIAAVKNTGTYRGLYGNTLMGVAENVNTWTDIVWGVDKFVAVASNNSISDQIMTSVDGITWVSRAIPAITALQAVTYGGGKFVAVGSTTGTNVQRLIFSSDGGVTWAVATSAPTTARNWSAVTYGNGLFVAVADTDAVAGMVITSIDGETWLTATASEANAWTSVVWAGSIGLFVAVSSTGTNRVMTSPTGTGIWTARSAAALNTWESVAWSEELGILMAVASDGTAMSSIDGFNWILQTTPSANTWVDINWVSELFIFVAMSSDGTRDTIIMNTLPVEFTQNTVTTDVINIPATYHTYQSYPSRPDVGSMLYNRTYHELKVYDGSDWKSLDHAAHTRANTKLPLTGGFISGDVIVASGASVQLIDAPVADTSAANKQYVDSQTSMAVVDTAIIDPIYTWKVTTNAAISDDKDWTDMRWIPELSIFIAAGTLSSGIAISADGINWDVSTDAAISGIGFRKITWSPKLGLIYALGTSTTSAVSSDGVRWTTVTTLTTVADDIIWSDKLELFLVIESTFMYSSADGITWTTSTAPDLTAGTAYIAYSPELNLIVAASHNGASSKYLSVSADVGETWTTVTITPDQPTIDITGIVWSSDLGLFVVVSDVAPRGAVSTDGYNWLEISMPAVAFTGVKWISDLQLFAASTTSDTFYTSIDGRTWVDVATTGPTACYEWSPELNMFAHLDDFTGSFSIRQQHTWVTRQPSIISTHSWTDITWAGGTINKFIAVSSTSAGISADGITWTMVANAVDEDWQSVAWDGANLLVAVAASGTVGNQIMTSTNGTSWSTATSPVAREWRSVVWAGSLSLFVAVASTGTGDRVMTSTTGTDTWLTADTSGATSEDEDWQSIAWDGSRLVAVASTGAVGDQIMTSTVGTGTWASATSPVAREWRSVVWASGLTPTPLFVAVASTGTGDRVMTSATGTGSWLTADTSGATGQNNDWQSIGWNGTTLVAVASTGVGDRIMTSVVGTATWATQPSAADNAWQGIAHNGGSIFAAVASTGFITDQVMTSDNTATTWTSQTIDAKEFTSIVWSPKLSLFAAVSKTGTGVRVQTSPDGATWTSQTSASDNDWQSITYGANKFVAVSDTGAAGTRFMTSTDGITWTAGVGGIDKAWQSIVYAPELGLFVAVANDGVDTSEIMTSPDASNNSWTVRTAPAIKQWTNITWSPQLRLLVAVANDAVMTSPNGIDWTVRVAAAAKAWSSIAWSEPKGVFVAVANNDVDTAEVMYSADGVNWIIGATPTSEAWSSVIWVDQLNMFIAVASGATTTGLITSPDGISWTAYDTFTADTWSSLAWSPDLGIAVAISTTVASMITDSLETWALSTGTPPSGWNAVAHAQKIGTTVAVGPNKAMYSINGGVTWTTSVSGDTSRIWVDVVWASGIGLFVAITNEVTDDKQVMTSPDGLTWTVQTASVTGVWRSIAWSEELSLLVACRDIADTSNTMFMYSNNGTNWFTGTGDDTTTAGWAKIVWGADTGRFIAISDTVASLQYSTDGKVWFDDPSVTIGAWTCGAYAPPSAIGNTDGRFIFMSSLSTTYPNRVLYSDDGGLTTTVTAGGIEDIPWESVIWDNVNSRFVAISSLGAVGTNIATSVDGLTWVGGQTTPEAQTWQSITFAASINSYIAVSTKTDTDAAMTTKARSLLNPNIDILKVPTSTNRYQGAEVAPRGALTYNTDQSRLQVWDGANWVPSDNYAIDSVHILTDNLAQGITPVNGNSINGGSAALGDGTVALPSVSFASDPDTGLYRVAADSIGIATNGTLGLNVSATQEVVIPFQCHIGPNVSTDVTALTTTSTLTDTSGTIRNSYDAVEITPSGASTAKAINKHLFTRINTGSGGNALISGIHNQVTNTSNNAITSLFGLENSVAHSGTGTITNCYGIYNKVSNDNTATITSSYGMYIDTPGNSSGIITTNYGLYIASQNVGTTKWGLYQAGPENNLFSGPVQMSNYGIGNARFDATGNLSSVQYVRTTVVAPGTTTYTILESDEIIGVTTTASNPVTLTLPTISSLGGSKFKKYIIKDEGGNATNDTITINAGVSDTINFGVGTEYTLGASNGVVQLYNDGVSKWFTF